MPLATRRPPTDAPSERGVAGACYGPSGTNRALGRQRRSVLVCLEAKPAIGGGRRARDLAVLTGEGEEVVSGRLRGFEEAHVSGVHGRDVDVFRVRGHVREVVGDRLPIGGRELG